MSEPNMAAFPFQFTDRHGTHHVFTGMSTREYAAIQAMQGLCANHSMIDSIDRESAAWLASKSILAADALIAALAKETP